MPIKLLILDCNSWMHLSVCNKWALVRLKSHADKLFVFQIIYIYIYISAAASCRPLVRISLTLARRFSLSFIASGRSSGLHPESSHSCCMYVRAGRPAFARPYMGVQRSTSLISSSLLLQQCPACLVRLTIYIYIYMCMFVCMYV